MKDELTTNMISSLEMLPRTFRSRPFQKWLNDLKSPEDSFSHFLLGILLLGNEDDRTREETASQWPSSLHVYVNFADAALCRLVRFHWSPTDDSFPLDTVGFQNECRLLARLINR